jgi:hypothetical protein
MALPKTFTGGERLFAADLNDNFEALDSAIAVVQADVDTNEANLNASNLNSGTVAAARFPTNSIVQVKTFSFDDQFIQSFADSTPVAVPDFNIEFTPLFATSKLLVCTTIAVSSANSESYFANMYRTIGAGTEAFNHHLARIIRGQASVFENRYSVMHYTRNYLDAPATTDTVTYQVYVSSSGAGASLAVNRSQIEADRRSNSHITVYEVKQ